MAMLLVGINLGLVSISALDLADTIEQNFDVVQRQGLTLVGNFLQQQDLPAPWMTREDRRLQTAGLALSDACKTACPNAEAAMGGLQTKMKNAMEPYRADMPSASTSGSTDPSAISAMMSKMAPMMKSVLEVTFDDMCTNKANYACITANSNVCSSSSSNMGMVSADNPAATASLYGHVVDCVCDVCPSSKEAYIQMSSKMMVVMMEALTSGLSGGLSGDPAQAQEKAKNSMMNAMCPMAGVVRCFDANPTKCAAMTQGSAQQGLSMMLGNGSLAGLKGQCDRAGISTAAPKLNSVSTELTISGLDFDKVNSNTQFKNELMSSLKANLLTKMPGYVSDDIRISLSPGSVKATVTVDPLPGSASTLVESTLNSAKTNVQSQVLAEVKSMPALSSVLQDGTTSDQLNVTVSDAKEEANPEPIQSPADGGCSLQHVAVLGIFGMALSQFAI
jgi:hypothetical protein